MTCMEKLLESSAFLQRFTFGNVTTTSQTIATFDVKLKLYLKLKDIGVIESTSINYNHILNIK